MRRLPADAGSEMTATVTPAWPRARTAVNDAGRRRESATPGTANADSQSVAAPGPEGDREHVGYVLQLVDRPLDPFNARRRRQ